MEIGKIYKLLSSTNWEDRVIGASLLDKMESIEEFKERYRYDNPPPSTGWSMAIENWTLDGEGFYIEGKHGWYFFGSDLFSIDNKEQRNYWHRFKTRESWI